MASGSPVRIVAAAEDRGAEHLCLSMRDGTLLATDIYLPAKGKTPVPTVLIRLPYDKSGRYTFIPQIAEYFAAHDFACVAQDVRGKYRSEGELEPFVHEADDGLDTLEWIISQPWSSGVVGTWGDSYYGYTQWALASRHHPAHQAKVPRVTGHRFGDMRPGGGMPTFTLLDWIVDAWSVAELIDKGGVDHGWRPSIESVHVDLPRGQELYRQFARVPDLADEWVSSIFPDGDPASNLRIPALHVGGWFDNLQFWQLDDWESAKRSSPMSEHQFLRMGTNDHEDYCWREPGAPLGPDFAEDYEALSSHLPGLLDEAISFFDHYLRGKPGKWPAPTVKYEHARVGLRYATQWPPLSVETRKLHLTRGRLGDAEAADGEYVEWTHDPASPVPFPIPSEWDQNRSGVPDERHLHQRDDVLPFNGPMLEEAFDLAGRVEFHGRITASTKRTHVVARLCDVYPDSSARVIVANAADVCADGDTVFVIRLGDTAYRLPAGHRLRLAVSTSLHGQYVIHPGTEEDPWTATEGRRSRLRLHLAGAALSLTVDPGDPGVC